MIPIVYDIVEPPETARLRFLGPSVRPRAISVKSHAASVWCDICFNPGTRTVRGCQENLLSINQTITVQRLGDATH